MRKVLIGKNDLKTLFPEISKEWDYENNLKKPEEYAPKSNQEVYWVCSKCGYRFKAKICNRTNRGGGCACCSNKIIVQGINDFCTTHPDLAKEWHPTKNGEIRPTDVSYGRATKIWWLCPEGHEYTATLNHRSSGTNCPFCNSGRQTSFAEQAVFYYVKKVFPDAINRYKDIFDNGMEIDIYIPSIKLAIEYDGMFWHTNNKSSRERKKYEICAANGIKLYRLKEDLSRNDFDNSDKSLGIEGNMYEHKQLAQVIRILLDEIDPESNMWTRKNPYDLHSRVDINIKRDEAEIRSYMTKLRGDSLENKFPNIAKEWHPTKNKDLLPSKVYPHSDIVVWWLCPDCNHEYTASIGHRSSGTGCPVCGITKSALKRSRQVIMMDPITKEELKTFNSISEAARVLNISSSNISMVCQGKRSKASGYSWKYSAK